MTPCRADDPDQVLAFCARDPVERVFLEDVARRGLGRFLARRGRHRRQLTALCHIGREPRPLRASAAASSPTAAPETRATHDHRRGARGRRAVGGRARAAAEPREDRPQPAGLRDRGAARARADAGLRPATLGRPRAAAARPAPRRTSSSSASTRCGATPRPSAGAPRRRSTRAARGSGSRTTSCSSRPRRRRGRRAPCRSSRCGSTRRRAAAATRARGLRDLCRLLLERTPTVTLFVRSRERARDRALRVASG